MRYVPLVYIRTDALLYIGNGSNGLHFARRRRTGPGDRAGVAAGRGCVRSIRRPDRPGGVDKGIAELQLQTCRRHPDRFSPRRIRPINRIFGQRSTIVSFSRGRDDPGRG